jgi:hypothetical protein
MVKHLEKMKNGNAHWFLCSRVEEYQNANEDHVCLYKPLSNHSTPQQQIVQFSFAPRLKGSNEVQQVQLEASTTAGSALMNVSFVPFMQ